MTLRNKINIQMIYLLPAFNFLATINNITSTIVNNPKTNINAKIIFI
jgi:hypothetical protein